MSQKDRAYILWLLSRQAYARDRLVQKLTLRGLSRPEADNLLDDLQREGFYREGEFSRLKTRQLVRKGYTRGALQAKLRSKGAQPRADDIAQAYEELAINPQDQLQKLLEKELRRSPAGKSDPQKFRARLLRRLMSKGHASADILRALKMQKPEPET